jgi:hypothetical protein
VTGDVDETTTAGLVGLTGGALDDQRAAALVLRTASQAAALSAAMR